jgi:hypothetical protein
MNFKPAATVGLALWATLGAPNIERSRADHPLIAAGTAVATVGILTAGGLGFYAIYKGVGYSATGTADLAEGKVSGGVEIAPADGGGDGDGGGQGEGSYQMAASASAVLPQDFGFQTPFGYQMGEKLTASQFANHTARWESEGLLWEGDVLTPGYVGGKVAHEVTRLGSVGYERPAGVAPGDKITVVVDVLLDDLDVSTTPIDNTHGFAGFEYRIHSPQLGVLFQAGGSVHQGEQPVFTGMIPPQAYDAKEGEFHLDLFQQHLELDFLASDPQVDIFYDLVTFGTGVKEQGDLQLKWTGGELGGLLTYAATGDPNEAGYQVFSFTPGPTPLSGLDADDPRFLKVGPQIPILSGAFNLDGAGQGLKAFPIPPDPIFAGLPIYSQMVTAPGLNTFIDNVSNPTAVVLGEQGHQHVTLDGQTLNRSQHAATTLADGRVLLTGGLRQNGNPVLAHVVFDPQTTAVEPVEIGLATGPRTGHDAILLDDGRVLILGGRTPNGSPKVSTELISVSPDGPYFPSQVGPAMPEVKFLGRATKLADGRVLVTGGATDPQAGSDGAVFASASPACFLFDPSIDAWQPTAPLPTPVLGHGQSQLADGTVLLTGGVVASGNGFEASSATWLFDPVAEKWSLGDFLPEPKAFHSQIPTATGGAYVAGGGKVAEFGGGDYELQLTDSTFYVEFDGFTAGGFFGAAPMPSSLLGPTMCWFCHPGGWYCGMPCIGPIGEGPIIVNPEDRGNLPTTQGADMGKFSSSFDEIVIMATTLFERGGSTLTLLEGGDRALIAGSDAGPTPSEVLFVGDGSKF